jgi:CelD/BcsL family acetyltransferase involved in cellulose biosynthesis
VLPWLGTLGRSELEAIVGQAGPLALLVREPLRGLPGCELLRPPGLGVSDYLDLLLPSQPGPARAAAEALFEHLLERTDWSVLDLPNLPEVSLAADLVEAVAAGRGLPCIRLRTNLRPYVDLRPGWQSLLESRPGKLRYNLRSRLRRLEREGTVAFRNAARPDEIGRALPWAIEMHARRWAGQRTSTAFSSSPIGRQFYREACPLLAERDLLELASLELDGRPIAFALCLLDEHRLYYYLPAFEPAFGKFAPSTLLLAHLLERAAARGLCELDFMLGDESYKWQWASGSRATVRLAVGAPGLIGRTAFNVFRGYLLARESARRSRAIREVRRRGLRGLLARRDESRRDEP